MNQLNMFAVVTGASSGIGRELSIELAQNGYNLILISRRVNELETLAHEINSLGKKAVIKVCDLTHTKSVSELANELAKNYPNIKILINNAGISQRSFLADTELEVYRILMEVNYFSAITLTSALLPVIINNNGDIITISSLSGLFGFPLRGGYSASKHALKGFFETLQLEEPKLNTLIAYPGRIKTPISISALTGKGSVHGKMDEGQLKGIDARKCAKRILQASKRRKKSIKIGKSELLLYYIYVIFKPLFYIIASRVNPNK